MYPLHSPIVGFDESGVNFDHISLTSEFIFSFFFPLLVRMSWGSLSNDLLVEVAFGRGILPEGWKMQTKLAKSS